MCIHLSPLDGPYLPLQLTFWRLAGLACLPAGPRPLAIEDLDQETIFANSFAPMEAKGVRWFSKQHPWRSTRGWLGGS